MNKYPFTINDLMNTDALAKAIVMLQEEVKNFVVANTIKYADPIQWNITTQYERNTVVIDPLTGTAYISVQPVPMGISLANTDYWTVVFNLSEFVTRAARNFSLNYEETTTLTATFPTNKGGWLVWNDTLYVANVNITPGDQYVDEVGGNITRITMESIIGNMNDLLTAHKDNIVNIINEVYTAYTTLNAIIGDMSTLDVPDVTTVVAALNVLYTAVNNIAEAIIEINGSIGNLDNLATTDKTSIVAAVNEVLSDTNDVYNKVGDLDNLATADKTSIVAAVNEVLSDTDDVDAKVGDLTDLHTSVKTSIVDAINDIESIVTAGNYLNVKDFGAMGDGITDDTSAIQTAFSEACNSKMALYFPAGVYCITSPIDMSNTAYYTIFGDARNTYITATAAMTHMLKLSGDSNNTFYGYRNIYNLAFDANNLADKCIEAAYMRYSQITNCVFARALTVCLNAGCWMNTFTHCTFEDAELGIKLAAAGSAINNDIIDNCNFSNINKGIMCYSNHDLHILKCGFDVCRDYAILLTEASMSTVIENCYFEACGTGAGIVVQDESNNNITMKGTILCHGIQNSLTYFHAGLRIMRNFFANCYSNICCMSHIANVTFKDNGFLGNYNALVELVWRGSHYVLSERNEFIAANSRDSTIKYAVVDNTGNGKQCCTNIIGKVLNKISNNVQSDINIDLLAMTNINGEITESGTATEVGYFDGDKVYELSSNFNKELTIDLTKSNLRGKYATFDGYFCNKSGTTNGLWLYAYINGNEVYNGYATTGDNVYRSTNWGFGFTIPEDATSLVLRVKTTYSNSGVYATKVKLVC